MEVEYQDIAFTLYSHPPSLPSPLHMGEGIFLEIQLSLGGNQNNICLPEDDESICHHHLWRSIINTFCMRCSYSVSIFICFFSFACGGV